MADIKVGKVGREADATTINAANNYVLGSAGDHAAASWTVELEATGWTGNLVPKARAAGSSSSWKAVPYTSIHLNGVAGTGAEVTTTITTTSVIRFKGEGLEFSVDCTSFTGGSVAMRAYPTAS